MDEGEATTKTTGDDWEAMLLERARGSAEPEQAAAGGEEQEEEEEEEEVVRVIDRRTANSHASDLLNFALSSNSATIVALVSQLQLELQSQQLAMCSQQSSISDFFRKG